MRRSTIRKGIRLAHYSGGAQNDFRVYWRGKRLGSVICCVSGNPDDGYRVYWVWTFETGRASRLVPDRRSRGQALPTGAAIALVYAHLRARRKMATKYGRR